MRHFFITWLGILSFLFSGALLPLSAQTVAESAQDTFALQDKYRVRQALYERREVAFPPSRKTKWSVGIQKGLSFVSGDVRAERGLGIGINVRKGLGSLVSLRGQVSTGYASGLDWRPSGGFLNNEALNGTIDPAADYTSANSPFVFYNYRMRYWDFGFHGILQLGNISFNQKEPRVGAYFFAGPGLMLYRSYTNALDTDGDIYDYSGIPAEGDITQRTDALNALRNLLDSDYETETESYTYKPEFANRIVLPTIQFGGALAFKMSNVVDLSLEHRVTFTNDDLLDGQRWEETLTPSARNDWHHFSTIGLNFRFGKNRAEATWWANPLEEPYENLRQLNRVARGDQRDSDKDGISNDLDLEPNTPEGVAVDVRGRALDSDGDGVPDFRDKEPFTPKGARVDGGGMALDRDRDGIIDVFDQEPDSRPGAQVDPRGIEITGIAGGGGTTTVISGDYENPLPMVHFDLGRHVVKQEFYPDLLRIARFMRANENLTLTVVGHTDTKGSGEANEALSQRRAEEVYRILTTTFQIDPNRLGVDWKGDDDLLINNPSGSEREKLNYLNRRVEFVTGLPTRSPGMESQGPDQADEDDEQPQEEEDVDEDDEAEEEEDIDEDDE